MTDKQIIIDRVDVSKCIYFQQEDDEYTCGAEECNGAIVACIACDNCYFKQLARKTQECKRLKKYLGEIRNQELFDLDIDWDEYETQCTSTEYSNIINLVEEALGEREDGRF